MKTTKFLIIPIIATIFLFSACGDGETGNDTLDEIVDENTSDDHVTKLGNRLFSIPSPVQTAQLVQNSGAQYNGKILNDPENAKMYATKVQKGLNLGVYGADLGYVNLYEQTQDAITYLGAAKKLADDLGVSGAFSPELIEEFESNLGNTDSLLMLVSDAYQVTDQYLQNNENNDIGSLILAGGWIEALYFATKVNETSPTDALKQRIGEQKFSIVNLIKLLEIYSNGEDFGDLITSLRDLNATFEKVEVNYEYSKPVIDADKKLAVINSTTEVVISEELVAEISEKIAVIRNNIIE